MAIKRTGSVYSGLKSSYTKYMAQRSRIGEINPMIAKIKNEFKKRQSRRESKLALLTSSLTMASSIDQNIKDQMMIDQQAEKLGFGVEKRSLLETLEVGLMGPDLEKQYYDEGRVWPGRTVQSLGRTAEESPEMYDVYREALEGMYGKGEPARAPISIPGEEEELPEMEILGFGVDPLRPKLPDIFQYGELLPDEE